jgi:hypothetical protein
MHDKPLDPSERNLLTILKELMAARDFVTRDVLSVATRGRGVEFGRSYARIKSLALIVEVERRPFLLRRLFGAPTLLLVQLTAAGRLAVSDGEAPTTAILPDAVALDAVQPAGAALAEPVPAAAPEAKRKAQAPKRRPISGYTEDLGGAPVPPAPVTPAAAPDPQAIEALREVLSGLGIELTMAGEMLAHHRIAQGDSGAEALMQVVLYTFAHAVHHDLSNGRASAALGLADYAVEVQREVQKLCDAGAVSAARLDADMGQLSALMGGDENAANLAASLLQDPVGGAAPPAFLPEELRAGQSDGADEEDRF